MEIEATYICAYCFQENEIVVDGSGGKEQRYIEECQVCCRPNVLVINVDDELKSAEIVAEVG